MTHKEQTIHIVINTIIKDQHGAGEGCKLKAYWDKTGECWTVGYGSTGKEITKDTLWTQDKAESELVRRLSEFYDQAIKSSPILAKVSPNKAAAITDFVYNGGIGMYTKYSVKPHIDAQRWEAAAERLKLFNKSGGVKLGGLVKRRALEAKLLVMA
jgi:lysozyme